GRRQVARRVSERGAGQGRRSPRRQIAARRSARSPGADPPGLGDQLFDLAAPSEAESDFSAKGPFSDRGKNRGAEEEEQDRTETPCRSVGHLAQHAADQSIAAFAKLQISIVSPHRFTQKSCRRASRPHISVRWVDLPKFREPWRMAEA